MSDPSLLDDELDEDEDDLDADEGNRLVGGLSRSVLEYLAKSIVDDRESVVIEAEEGRKALTLRLHVAPSDMGRIIGRRGRVAQAIRTVVRAAGAREGVEANVDIAD
ncbi:MAG: KH domain-containing protein [Acidimicrobiia bacterium]